MARQNLSAMTLEERTAHRRNKANDRKRKQRKKEKAEIMVGQLIDAAASLARIVNDYKRDEIDVRIAEIEQSDLSTPDAKKKAFADMARLKKMRDQLDKQVRWTFPQWKVTGE